MRLGTVPGTPSGRLPRSMISRVTGAMACWLHPQWAIVLERAPEILRSSVTPARFGAVVSAEDRLP